MKTKRMIVTLLLALALVMAACTASPTPAPQTEAQQQPEEVTPSLSEKRADFLSLLEQNIVSGGPPKDGIPSIDNPQYTTAVEADEWLFPHDIVFGVDHEGFVAAYPQRILVWHEIANVDINRENLSVTYCPLTGTAIGFKGEYRQGVNPEFGVSGKLVNSNMVMYDRESDSYWPQILGQGISGPARGISLQEFPVVWTTWEKWKGAYPDTLVLSRDTGFFRDYSRDPYGSYIDDQMGYYSSERVMFRPIHEDIRLHPKEVVIGVRDTRDNALAILKDRLREDKVVEASLGDVVVVVTYDKKLDFYEARIKETGEWINAFDAMWFAWAAFYPQTELVE